MLLWFCQGSALASHLLQEQELLGEFPVVLTASRLKQPQADAPAPVTIIDRQVIEASGATEVPELLRLVPGYIVGQLNGHQWGVTHYGLGTDFGSFGPTFRRMQVLVDGRSVYSPMFGGVQWSDIPLVIEDIDRIEVIRGPNAAVYGANSFFGVINIITREPTADVLTVKHTQGSNSIEDTLVRWAGREKSLSYRVSIKQHQDEGFNDRNDGKQVPLGTVYLGYQINTHQHVSVEAGYNGGTRGVGVPPEAALINTNPNHDMNILSRYQQLHWTYNRGSDNEYSLRFYHNDHRETNSWLSAPISLLGGFQVVMNETIFSDRYHLEYQQTNAITDRGHIVWGANIRRDKVTSPRFFGIRPKQQFYQRQLFSHVEWRLFSPLLVHGGVMIENNEITETRVSPRFAMNYQFNKNHTLRYSISKGNRTPTLIEDRADYQVSALAITDHLLLGNPDLRPESIKAQEFGYLGSLFDNRLRVDANVHRCKVEHVIATRKVTKAGDNRDGTTREFFGEDLGSIKGMEMQGSIRPHQGTRIDFAYAYTDLDFSDQLDSFSVSAPFNNFSVIAIQNLPHHLLGSAAFYLTGPIKYVSSVTPLKTTRVIDFRLAYNFESGSTKGEIAMFIQHAIDEFKNPGTIEFQDFRTPDSRALASLSLDFR